MILEVQAGQRLDSRGNPTVQVDVKTSHGVFRAMVPSGASTGSHEAVELRDKDKPAYGGKGVLGAVDNVRSIIGPALIEKGFNPQNQQKEIDAFMCELDGTPNKSRLGANAILGVSMACSRAGAAAADIPLYEFLRREANENGAYIMPVPFFNVLDGGRHSGNTMAFREFMIAPTGAQSFEEALRMGSETYSALQSLIARKFGPPATGIGDEGGFAPPITTPEEALDLLTEAVDESGYTGKIKFAIDSASSEFFKDGVYDLGFKTEEANPKSPAQMMELYNGILDKYPIALLEDPFAEDDWDSWTKFNENCQHELVGDDLLVANVDRVRMAHEKKACNSMLLKVNQIGTVSEAIEAARFAKSLDWSVFVSHRSGETTDDFIADLAVGLATGHIKSGAPCRGERVAKYNRLLEIETDQKDSWKPWSYAGEKFRFPEISII
ncbi:putative enolase [Apodospora peruviana]|uniref:Enolase n=1 Tax=Apodospora peruviana TaxID=516989 RepID=A0AAE0ITW4_9PEZI|nr:putative enolase [Apodospora peruviana]